MATDGFVDIADFYPEVAPDVANCPSAVMRHAVCRAATYFCEQTLLWTYQLDGMKSRANVAIYELDPPPNSRVAKMLRVTHDSKELIPISSRELDYSQRNWRTQTARQATYYFEPSMHKIRLVPMPELTVAKAIYVDVALKPKVNATELAEFLYHDWVDTIACGAKYYLQTKPGKPWTNDIEARENWNQFSAGLNDGRWRELTSNTSRSGLQVKMRPFA